MVLVANEDQDVDVSVVVCTHNRSDDVAANLPSIVASCRATDLRCEVIVVDNAPKDLRTRATAAHARCRYVLVEARVVSFARNAAADAARGRVLVSADDDVRVPLNWVEEMSRPILTGACDVVAGAIVPGPGRDLPWMGPHLKGSLTLNPVDGEPSHVIGASYACATVVFSTVRFDPQLGGGTCYGSAEDVLFYEQVKAAGFRVLGCSCAPVLHNFNLARMGYEGLCRKAEAVGRSDAYIMYHWLHSQVRWLTLRIAVARFEVMVAACRRPRGQGMQDHEFAARVSLACKQQLRSERGTPRNYPRLGLSRRSRPASAEVLS